MWIVLQEPLSPTLLKAAVTRAWMDSPAIRELQHASIVAVEARQRQETPAAPNVVKAAMEVSYRTVFVRDALQGPLRQTRACPNVIVALVVNMQRKVLLFVRLVDVETSMIKKHRAVAKIVSQVPLRKVLAPQPARNVLLAPTQAQQDGQLVQTAELATTYPLLVKAFALHVNQAPIVQAQLQPLASSVVLELMQHHQQPLAPPVPWVAMVSRRDRVHVPCVLLVTMEVKVWAKPAAQRAPFAPLAVHHLLLALLASAAAHFAMLGGMRRQREQQSAVNVLQVGIASWLVLPA